MKLWYYEQGLALAGMEMVCTVPVICHEVTHYFMAHLGRLEIWKSEEKINKYHSTLAMKPSGRVKGQHGKNPPQLLKPLALQWLASAAGGGPAILQQHCYGAWWWQWDFGTVRGSRWGGGVEKERRRRVEGEEKWRRGGEWGEEEMTREGVEEERRREGEEERRRRRE